MTQPSRRTFGSLRHDRSTVGHSSPVQPASRHLTRNFRRCLTRYLRSSPRRRAPHHADRREPRHPVVHESRAGDGRPHHRRAHGHLLVRRDAVRGCSPASRPIPGRRLRRSSLACSRRSHAASGRSARRSHRMSRPPSSTRSRSCQRTNGKRQARSATHSPASLRRGRLGIARHACRARARGVRRLTGRQASPSHPPG
jgi:hypothetical protein